MLLFIIKLNLDETLFLNFGLPYVEVGLGNNTCLPQPWFYKTASFSWKGVLWNE